MKIMKLRSSVICGLIGSCVRLIVQLFYFILNTYFVGYIIPEPVYTLIGIATILAWLLIVCFLIGLLKKTK